MIDRQTPTVPDEWIRCKADEIAVSRGYYFDASKGRKVIDFIETFCKPSQGDSAGVPMKLIPWQKDFLMRLFGWRRPDGRRRFRSAHAEIPKKNGKSAFVSALSACMLVADGEKGPDNVCCATTREQATQVFDETAKMVRASEELNEVLRVVNHRKTIYCDENNGRFRAISADANANDGGNWSFVIIDEVHRIKDRGLWNLIEHSGGARSQPLRIGITTAGEEESGPWYEERVLSERINNGEEINNLTHLGVIYRADPNDDPGEPATWRKANPSLGYTLTEESLAETWQKVKDFPAQVADFKRLRLNIVTSGESAFLRPEDWIARGGRRSIFDLGVHECFLGIDLSSRTDLTALIALFPLGSRRYYVHSWFWLPRDRVADLEKKDRMAYRALADQGHITLTDGTTVDYDSMIAQIATVRSRFDIKALGCDGWNAASTISKLQVEFDINCQEIDQKIGTLSEPTKELESMVLDGRLTHSENPIMDWNARNAVVYRDPNNNIRLNKAKSRNKIDGMSALVNALALAVQPVVESESVYETRGVRRL